MLFVSNAGKFFQISNSRHGRTRELEKPHGGKLYVSEAQRVSIHIPLMQKKGGVKVKQMKKKKHLSNMIIYRSEDLLGRNQETCHLPDCHFEIHLRKLE